MHVKKRNVVTTSTQGLPYFLVFIEAYFAYEQQGSLEAMREALPIFYAPHALFYAPLKQMTHSKDDAIRNEYSEMKMMFQDPSQQARYEKLLFADQEWVNLYREFLKVGERLLQGHLKAMRTRFVEPIQLLQDYLLEVVVSTRLTTITMDLDSALSRLYYFLLFTEAVLLLEKEVSVKELIKTASPHYLVKLSALGHLLHAADPAKIAVELFSKSTVSDYARALRAANWVYLENPVAAFAKCYSQISTFFRSQVFFIDDE